MSPRSILFAGAIVLLFGLSLAKHVDVSADNILHDVEIDNNSKDSARSAGELLDSITQFIQRNEVSINLPFAATKATISSRNLNNDELNLKFKFNADNAAGESRKSKLKKIAIPILTFVLLKAITLVPLGLGILGIKAFNALQLSFFSFVISVGLAVFQLCRKFAVDHQHPQIAAAPWETRNFNEAINSNEAAHNVAYNAYA